MTAVERVLREVSGAMSALGPLTSVSVGFSGGVDSTVLLAVLSRLRAKLALPELRALHVDHGLEACSAQWSTHCRHFCEALGVEFLSLTVDARASAKQSPEEAARAARYQAIREVMRAREVLCVAHHADDQAETSLLQMLRGAGVLGGGGMRPERDFSPGRLARPMLNVRRADIEACARSWQLHWIEDPANQRLRHPRNRLRTEVLPLLQDIAPGAIPALGRAAQLQREAADAVAELARLDWQRCRGQEVGSLSRVALSALPSSRRRAVLRLWLREHVRMPPQRRLMEIERQVCTAHHGGAPRIEVGQAQIELHGDAVLLFASAPPLIESALVRTWNLGHDELMLPHGRLWTENSVAGGLRGGAPVTVRVRRGGERCRPYGRARSQTLKRLLQAKQIPTWRRHGLPLLYRGNELVAVADLWVCAGHVAQAGEPGLRVQWQPVHRPLRSIV